MTEQLSFGDPNGWISRQTRLPTKEDADPHGCVLAWHEYNGAVVAGNYNYETPGWKRVCENACYTHWMRLPGRPWELEEKRRQRQESGGIAWQPQK